MILYIWFKPNIGSLFPEYWIFIAIDGLFLESVIKKYSDHISFPIFLHYDETIYGDKEKEEKDKIESKVSQINSASAFWKKPKKNRNLASRNFHKKS